MKLIQKTNLVYFLLSTVLLLVAGCILYYMITVDIDEEINEKLIVNKDRISSQIEEGKTITSLFPIIEIQQLAEAPNKTLVIKDTTLYDPVENDIEPFREISSFENINGKFYRITVRQVILEPHDYLNSIGTSLAIVMLILLVGLLLINRQISRNLWAPFYQNLEILKQYSIQDNKAIILKSTDITEFKELNRVILTLTEKIYSDYNSLKEFTENASHEIQTPLAIIQSKLEESLQASNLTKEQAEKINDAYISAQRLSKLNQTLLLLTKIENHQFNEGENTLLKTIIEKKLEQYEDVAQAKSIHIEKNINSTSSIKVSPILIDTLISNLIGNAIKHNVANGKINIELLDNSLTISNTGSQLTINPKRLFDRFSKANPSSKSLGLGLSIIKKICELYKWQINYSVNNNWHQITVRF